MLSVSGLRSGYGRIPILTGVDLAAADGEAVGILGHNGMGKTTLLRTLMGYLPATGGSVLFAGQDITRVTPTARARLGLGYVPQGREIFGTLTVADNLRMGCLQQPDPKQTIAAILEDFPRLTRLLDRLGGALSGGSSNCWRWPAACARNRSSSCWTSRPKASSRASSKRLSRRCMPFGRGAG